jgi:hypothetical protein
MVPSVAAMYCSLTKQASHATAYYIYITGTSAATEIHTVQLNPDVNGILN